MSKNLYDAAMAAFDEEFNVQQLCEMYRVKPVPLVQAIAEMNSEEES